MKKPKVTQRKVDEKPEETERDRLFVHIRTTSPSDVAAESAIAALEKSVSVTGIYVNGKLIMGDDAIGYAYKWMAQPTSERKYQQLIKDTIVDCHMIPWLETQ